MRVKLDQFAYAMPEDESAHVLVENEVGIIVGSRQRSYGYIYVTGCLKK